MSKVSILSTNHPSTPLPLAPTISLPMAPATPLLPLVPISELHVHVPTEPSFYQEPPPPPPQHHLSITLNLFHSTTCTLIHHLTSEQIPKHTLMSVEDSLKGCKELKSVEKANTLSQKLAKEAIFGVEIMKRCTPGGTKELPALPKEEMFTLKKAICNSTLALSG